MDANSFEGRVAREDEECSTADFTDNTDEGEAKAQTAAKGQRTQRGEAAARGET
jgi:hypothetical protein